MDLHRAVRRRPALLRPGSRGPDVEALQRHLARLGFYGGEVDGAYGELTEDAVRSLQRAFRLQADGVAGPQVLRLLEDPLLASARGRPPHLLVGWAEGAPDPARAPAWISAWAEPAGQVRADPLGRLDFRGASLALAGAGRTAVPVVPVVTLAPSARPAPLRTRGEGPWLAGLRHLAALGRVAVAAPEAPPTGRASGPAEVPPPGALRLARRLRRAGMACWLSLRILTPARRGALVWWGYEVARRTREAERVIVWAPGPESEMEAALGAVRAALRGMRRWRPPWQILLGLDLSPWLVEPEGEGRPSAPPRRRRLTRTEAVVAAWQLRLRRLRGEPPERLPVLIRCGAERVGALARLVRWAGLGGMVLRGLDRAEQPALAVLESSFAPVRFSLGDEAS
ncbi:MAG TPA: peptidoglycan-binding protein [Limnochordales bacterium]